MDAPTSTGIPTEPEPIKPWKQVAEESNIFSLPAEQRVAEYDKWSQQAIAKGIRDGDFDSRDMFDKFKVLDIRTRRNLASDDIVGPSDDDILADYKSYKNAFKSTQDAFALQKPTPEDNAIQGEVLQGKRNAAFVRGQMVFNPTIVNDPQKYREAILKSDAPPDIKMLYAGLRPEMEKSAIVTRRRELANSVITRDVADKVVNAIQEGTEVFGADIGTPQSPALKKNKAGVWSVVDPEYSDIETSLLARANAKINPLADAQYKPLAAINEYQKKYGLSDEQVQQDYMEALIENAPTAVNRWVSKATSVEEYVKQLDSTVRVKNKDVAPEVRVQDPNLFFDAEGYNAAVDKANAPEEAKNLAKEARTQFADAVAGDIYNNLLANRDDFREDYAKDVVKREDMAKAITRYYKDKKDQAWYDDVGEFIGQTRTALQQGGMNVIMTPSAVLGMFGSVKDAEDVRYATMVQNGQMQAEEAVANRTGGAGAIKLTGDVARILPDLAVQMAIGIMSGGALSFSQAAALSARTGLSKAAARTAIRQAAITGEKAALKTELAKLIPNLSAQAADDVATGALEVAARTMSNNPLKGGVGTQRAIGSAYAGLTSAGSTFGQVYTEVRAMGKSPEESIGIARTAGITAGAITGALTHAFGVLGRGGVEDFASMGRKAGEFTIRDIVKSGVRDVLTTQEGRQLTRSIASGIAKDSLHEGVEEGLDQALNLISQYATNPSPEAQNRKVSEVINESLYAGLLGMFAGGGANVVGQARATAPGITAQQMQAEILGANATVAPDVAPPENVAPSVAPAPEPTPAPTPAVQSADPVVQQAAETAKAIADVPDTSQTTAALEAFAKIVETKLPRPETNLPVVEKAPGNVAPNVAPQSDVAPDVAPEQGGDAELEEFRVLNLKKGQAQNGVKGVTFGKKDKQRYDELLPKVRGKLRETVNPESDPIVGVDINQNSIRISDNGTFYTVENGRVRTGPAFEENQPSQETSQPEPSATFVTELGSVYSVSPDGTTERVKAERDLPGHEGDKGAKKRSVRTVYFDASASALSAAGVTYPEGAKPRVVLKDGTATLTWITNGKRGSAKTGTQVPFYTEPAVGRFPLELWQPRDDVPGYEAYAGMHAGNRIVEIKTPAAEPAAPANAEEVPVEPTAEPATVKPETTENMNTEIKSKTAASEATKKDAIARISAVARRKTTRDDVVEAMKVAEAAGMRVTNRAPSQSGFAETWDIAYTDDNGARRVGQVSREPNGRTVWFGTTVVEPTAEQPTEEMKATEETPTARDATKPEQMTPEKGDEVFVKGGDDRITRRIDNIFTAEGKQMVLLQGLQDPIPLDEVVVDPKSDYRKRKQRKAEQTARMVAANPQLIRQLGDLAVRDKQPVSQDYINATGGGIPEGYVKEGELYVFKGEEAPLESDFTFSKAFSDPAYLGGVRDSWRELFGKSAEAVTIEDIDRVAVKKKWSNQTKDSYIKTRKPLIEAALREGLPVPDSVLADYKDLAPAPAAEAPAEKPAPYDLQIMSATTGEWRTVETFTSKQEAEKGLPKGRGWRVQPAEKPAKAKQPKPAKPDAVQEPKPDEGVLRQEGQSVGLPEVDQGGRGAEQESAKQAEEVKSDPVAYGNALIELFPSLKAAGVRAISIEESLVNLEDRFKKKRQEGKATGFDGLVFIVNRKNIQSAIEGGNIGGLWSRTENTVAASNDATPSAMAHEIGHAIMELEFEKAPEETKEAIRQEYSKWFNSTYGPDGTPSIPDQRRIWEWMEDSDWLDPQAPFPEAKRDANWERYRSEFSEWFADEVAKWATVKEEPRSLIDKFFSELAAKLTRLWDAVRGNFSPNETLSSWLDSISQPSPAKVEAAKQEQEFELTPQQQDFVVFMDEQNEEQEERQKPKKKRITPGEARKAGTVEILNRLGIQSNNPESVIGALEKIAASKDAPKHHIRIAKDLLSVLEGSGTSIVLVASNDPRIKKGDETVNGWYDPATNTAYINLDGPHELGIEETILHELVHASGEKVIRNPQTDAQKRILGNLQKQMEAATKNAISLGQGVLKTKETDLEKLIALAAGDNNYALFDILYGVSSLSEYHAHATTSKAFQRFLSEYKEGSKRNFFERFVNSLTSLLSGKKTVEGSDAEKSYSTLLDLMRENKGDVRLSNTDVVQSRAQGITAEMDSAFADAYAKGDTEAAQEMVDEAAKAAGYTVGPVYHHGGFDAAEDPTPRINEEGMHFGTKEAATQRAYGKQVDDFIKDGEIAFDEDVGAWFWSSQGIDSVDIIDEDGFTSEKDARQSLMDFASSGEEQASAEELGTFTRAFLRAGDAIAVPDQADSWVNAVAKAKAKGVESIKYKNLFEDKGSTSYIVFSPEQIKSADPFTFDDDGNLIPLSERFTEQSPDIRYSKARGIVSDAVVKFAPQFNVVDAPDGPSVEFDGLSVAVNPEKLANLEEYEVQDLANRAVVAAIATPKDPIAAGIIQQTMAVEAYNFDSESRKGIRKSLADAHRAAHEFGMAPLAMELGNRLFEFGGATDADVRKSIARGVPSDEEYADAHKRGDTQAAQEMVDKAARVMGFGKSYSKTDELEWINQVEDFTRQSRIALKNAENAALALQKKDLSPVMRGILERKIESYKKTQSKEIERPVKKLSHGTDRGFTVFTSGSRSFWAADSEDVAKTYGKNILRILMRMSNPLVINANGASFNSLTFEGQKLDADDLSEIAKERGHDGLVIQNFYDSNKSDGGSVIADHYTVFDPNQIKSAEPFTFDDSGELIPLSQRFQSDSPDIRYSSARGTELVTRVSGPALAWKKFISGFRSRGMVSQETYDAYRDSDAFKKANQASVSFWAKDMAKITDKLFGEGDANYRNFRVFYRDQATGEASVSFRGFDTRDKAEAFAVTNRYKDYIVSTGNNMINMALGSNGPTLKEDVRDAIEKLTKKGLDDIAKSIEAYKEEYLVYWNLVVLETQADMIDPAQIATLRERKEQWMAALRLRSEEQKKLVDDARKEAVVAALADAKHRIVQQQKFAKAYLPDDLVHQIERARGKIDELSTRLTEINWLMEGSELQMVIEGLNGVYVTRSYEAFETSDKAKYVAWLNEAYSALTNRDQVYDPIAMERIMPLVRHIKNGIMERRIEDLKKENDQRQVDAIMEDLMADSRQVTQVDRVPGQPIEGTEYEKLIQAVAKRDLLRRRSDEKKKFVRDMMDYLARSGFASGITDPEKRQEALEDEANRIYDERYAEQEVIADMFGRPEGLRWAVMTDDEAHDIANVERAISEDPGNLSGSAIWTSSINGKKHSTFNAAVNDDFQENLNFILKAPGAKTSVTTATANDWKRLGDKILEHKNDVPAFLRTFLGEKDNPLLRVSDTIMKQSHLIAVGNLYQNIAKMGQDQGWLVHGDLKVTDKKYDGWKTVLSSANADQGYENNPLKDMYADPVMAKAIDTLLAANQPSNSAFKVISRIVGISLWGVTAGSVRAIVRNLASLPIFLMNSGILGATIDPRRWPVVAKNVVLASRMVQQSMEATGKVSGGKQIEGKGFKLVDKVWTKFLSGAMVQRPALYAMKGAATMAEFASRMTEKPTAEQSQEMYLKAVRLGVANDNVQKEAIHRLLDIEDQAIRSPKDKNLGKVAKALKLEGAVGFGSYLLGTTKTALQQRSQLYGAPDDFTKILAWLNEMDAQARINSKDEDQYNEWRGKDGLFSEMPDVYVKKAADNVTNLIQSHSRVWAHITQFKKAGFGALMAPFAAARAEFYRNAANAYIIAFEEMRSDNPKEQTNGWMRLASALTAHLVMGNAIGAVVKTIFSAFADDDEIVDGSPEYREAVRRLGPEYAKNKNATYILYKNGTFDWLDLSFTNPFSFFWDSITAAKRGATEKDVEDNIVVAMSGEVIAENLGTFAKPQIALDALSTVRSGYDPVRGVKIWDSQADSFADKMMKSVTYYMQQAGLPGDFKDGWKIMKAARGVEENGRQYKVGTEVGAVFLGTSIRTVNITDALEQKLAQAKDTLGTRIAPLYKAPLRNANDVEMEDVALAVQQYAKAHDQAVSTMQKSYKAAETLLRETPNAKTLLRNVMSSDRVRMSQGIERAVVTGKPSFPDFSDQTFRKMEDLGKKHFDERAKVAKDTLKEYNQKKKNP